MIGNTSPRSVASSTHTGASMLSHVTSVTTYSCLEAARENPLAAYTVCSGFSSVEDIYLLFAFWVWVLLQSSLVA